MIYFIIFILLYIAQGVAFGIAVNKIIENKGWHDNWFWWGFFFGIIALPIAASKPEKHNTKADEENPLLQAMQTENILKNGGWKCYFCHSVNAFNVTSCSCGKNKEDSERQIKEIEKLKNARIADKAAASSKTSINKELEIVELISRYKKLLDSGAITQDEFETKKKSLLSKNE